MSCRLFTERRWAGIDDPKMICKRQTLVSDLIVDLDFEIVPARTQVPDRQGTDQHHSPVRIPEDGLVSFDHDRNDRVPLPQDLVCDSQ